MTRFQKSLIVFAASVVPHLYGFTSPPLDYHYHRQVNTAAIARNFYRDGLPFFHPRVTWDGNNNGVAATEFPLYMWLVGLFWPVFGLGDLWGRILSVLFSGLTAVMLYHFLARQLEVLSTLSPANEIGQSEDNLSMEYSSSQLSPKRREGVLEGEDGAAFWGALMFCFLPVEVYFGRTVQPEALALLCYAVSLLAVDRCLESAKIKMGWGILAAVCAGVSIGLKLPYAHLWLVLAFLVFARKGWKSFASWRPWVLLVVSALPVAAWYHYTSTAAPPPDGQEVLPRSFSAIFHLLDYVHDIRILGYYTFYQLFSRFPELTTTYAGLFFFAVGATGFYRRGLWFPLLWWAAVALYAIAGGGYTFHHEYTALPFALVNAAFFGAGFWEMRKRAAQLRGKSKFWAASLLAALVAAIPVHAALRIAIGPKSGHWYRVNYPFLLRVKPVIDRLSSPDDLFFCNNRAPSVYLYYIDRSGWSWDLRERGIDHLHDFDALTRKNVKFFLTDKNEMFRSKSDPIARHIFDNFPVAYEDKDVIIFKLHPLPF